jgi:parallel beta-helix repeat protein
MGLAGTTVSGNHVSGTDIGIYQYASPDCCTIRSNVLTNNRVFGIAIQDGNGETHRNTITGGQVGIGVIADSADTTAVLHGDRISRTTVAPVREIQCCGFTATARRHARLGRPVQAAQDRQTRERRGAAPSAYGGRRRGAPRRHGPAVSSVSRRLISSAVH